MSDIFECILSRPLSVYILSIFGFKAVSLDGNFLTKFILLSFATVSAMLSLRSEIKFRWKLVSLA